MRFQTISLSLVMTLCWAAPALAQETPPAEPRAPSAAVAPFREPFPEHQEWDAPQEQTEWSSPGMAAGGTVLTVLGGASTVLGVVGLVGSGGGGGGGSPNYAGPFGAAFLGGGVLMLGIGIPLIVSGASEVPAADAPRAAQTQLRVGPGSVDLSMEF